MTLPAALTIDAPFAALTSYLLIVGRLVAFFVVAPPFNGKAISGRVKGSLAVALAFAVLPVVEKPATTPDVATLVGATIYHLATGALMGFFVLVLFTAVQVAGDFIDLFSMFTMSSLYDPISGTNSAVFGRIQNLVGTTLLFASGGHLLVIRGVVDSFRVLPVHAPSLGEATERLVRDFSTLLVGALEISGPVVAVLVLTDIALGLVSRAVPSLNIFQLAFPVKTVLTVALASMAVALLPGAVSMITDRTVTDIVPLGALLGG